MKVKLFKMTYTSSKFNLNQKVFIVDLSGAQAACCYGRFRGRGRWIKAWVRWGDNKHPVPRFIEADIDDNSHIAKTIKAYPGK